MKRDFLLKGSFYESKKLMVKYSLWVKSNETFLVGNLKIRVHIAALN